MSIPDDAAPDRDRSIGEEDMAILTAVRDLYDRIDPMPSDLLERVRFAVAVESLDTEMAQLVETDSLAGVRSAPSNTDEPRTFLFEAQSFTVMISLSQDRGEMVRMDGWLAPEEEYHMELLTPQQRVITVSDRMGRFTATGVPRGLCCVLIHPSPNSTPRTEATAARTPTFRIE